MTNTTNTTPAADGTLDDAALDSVAGGRHNNDGLGFLAGALLGGVVGGIADAVTPHQPNVIFAAPQTQYIPQPTYIQAPPPVVYAQPQYSQPQYAAPGFAPAPVIVNSGW